MSHDAFVQPTYWDDGFVVRCMTCDPTHVHGLHLGHYGAEQSALFVKTAHELGYAACTPR